MTDVIRLSAAVGNPTVELHAIVENGSIVIERRWIAYGKTTPTEWLPMTIGSLTSLMAIGGPLAPWLEGHGVPWGSWMGRPPDEPARFRRT